MTPQHVLIAVLVATIWGVNFTFIKWALESFPPLFLTSLRFFLTAFPLLFFVKRPEFNRTFVIYALGSFAMQFGFVFFAMRLGASPGLTPLVLQLQVFITLLLAWLLLGEAMNRWQLLGLIVAFVGIVLIAANIGGDMPLWGFILLLVAGFGWSAGNIASKKLHHLSAISLVVWGGFLSSLALCIISLLVESPVWRLETLTNASLKSWLSLGFTVYLSTHVGYGLWAYLLHRNAASLVMPFALLVPMTSMLTSVILTNEQLPWWKIVAMVLIVGGLVIANLLPRWLLRGSVDSGSADNAQR